MFNFSHLIRFLIFIYICFKYLYLRHVAYDERKELEKKYNIKVDHNPLNRLVINDCPNNKISEVKQAISNICSRKNVKTIEFDPMPGLAEAYTVNRFKHEIELIQSKYIL